MGFFEAIGLAFGLSMDAFAVSVCKGLSVKKAGLRESVICGAWFGGFQGLMPLIGYFLGSFFADVIRDFDHWIAFALLMFIGFNMLKEAFDKEEECNSADMSIKAMFILAVSTSIDAMASGILFSTKEPGNGVSIYLAVLMIGAITFFMSAAGVKIGSVFGNKFEKKAQVLGGSILMILGIKILIEGLLEGKL